MSAKDVDVVDPEIEAKLMALEQEEDRYLELETNEVSVRLFISISILFDIWHLIFDI